MNLLRQALIWAVIGLRWGDCGKGKIVDLLAEFFDVVARYQGGGNAGHTIEAGGVRTVLHEIPSGILRPGKVCVLGNGMVLDIETLLADLRDLDSSGIVIDPSHFRISGKAHIILGHHKTLEGAVERARGSHAVGSTLKGIGYAYSDKIWRVGVRMGDLLFPDILAERVHLNVEHNNRVLKAYGAEAVSENEVLDKLLSLSERIRPFICEDSASLLNQMAGLGMNILLEGAQGKNLDIDHGYFPGVTSSNPTIGGACTGTGLPAQAITNVLGVLKAYDTCVGNHVFPTEMSPELASLIQDRGREFGATTGRRRRVGWLCAFGTRHAAIINGVKSLALMKIDILDGLDEVKLCVGYKREGVLLKDSPLYLNGLEPVYVTLPGWKSTAGITEWDDLPGEAKGFVAAIEDHTGCKVDLVSTGPDRIGQTIVRKGSMVAELMGN